MMKDNNETILNNDQALQDMSTLLPLQHGGHAYVFKTLENMVLKIVGSIQYRMPI
jgi:hypothetical protein